MHNFWKSWCLLFFFFFGKDDGDDLFFWKWMRHGRLPLVCKLMHGFWKPWHLRKRWFFFFFFKMDEAWPNAPSLEMDAWFLEILIFFFFLKRWWWTLFFWKWMRHGRMPLVCKLMHDFWKPWYLRKRWFFFFNMDVAWPNAPSLEIDAWFLEILIFFFWKDDDDLLLFWKWMRHGRMPLVQLSMWILKNLIV